MPNLVVVGNGGHARACIDAWSADPEVAPLGYLGPEPGDVLGLEYLGDDGELSRLIEHGVTRAFVALGSNAARRAAAEHCLSLGLELATIVSPTAQVAPSARLGAGTIVMRGAIVGANARIGTGAIVNTGATVDHDCTIGDFVHIAPGVNLAGTITVGDEVLVGIGSCVTPNVHIGNGATVGAGAVVVRDVAPGQTVVSTAATELKR